MRTALELTHRWMGERLRPGDTAVDATVGNGYDTVFLADCVGETGRVFGFDIQADAIASAEARLAASDLSERVFLFRHGHEEMRGYLPEDAVGRVAGVLFNLGFLPGGDHGILTRAETTLPALEQSCELLSPGGLLEVVMYRGHAGGAEEADAVLEWAGELDQSRFSAFHYHLVNQRNTPPELLGVEKLA